MNGNELSSVSESWPCLILNTTTTAEAKLGWFRAIGFEVIEISLIQLKGGLKHETGWQYCFPTDWTFKSVDKAIENLA